MQRIQVLVTTQSPLAIGQQKTGSSISEVETFIPGTVLRGAIAGQMLRQDQTINGTPSHLRDFAQEPDSDFKTLFIDNQAIFQNLYPALTKNLEIREDVRVLPATALSAKNASGFKSGDTDSKNGAFDSLIDRFCAEAYGQVYDPNCPSDNSRVDGFSGLYSIEDNRYSLHSATTRLLTRVGINRRRATAEDQILYSLQVLNETKQHPDTKAIADMVFAGHIWVCDDLAQPLLHYIQAHGQDLRLGGATSRGLGKIAVQADSSPPKDTLSARIGDLNTKLKQRWQQWSNLFGSPASHLDLPSRCFFTLNLQSAAILKEQWLRTIVISEAMLQTAVGVTAGNLQLHAAYSSAGQRSGWNNAWGLPKDLELTTERGAVYLFSVDESTRSVWESALATLEITGIGDFTAEGFGQVRVCDEFHTILREDAV